MTVLTASSVDLKKKVLQHCGELIDGTSDYDTDGDGRALLFLNKAYLSILAGSNEFEIDLGEPWSWAVESQPGSIVLKTKITGTATATLDSTALTFSVAPTGSLAGWFIQFAGNPEWYYITSHTSGLTPATLASAFTDTSGSFAYTAIKTDYTLAPNTNGILRLVMPMKVGRTQDFQGDDDFKVYFLDKATIEKDFPKARLEEGTPTNFTVIAHDPSDNTMVVRFNKVPTVQTTVEYDYIAMPDALTDVETSVPIVPITFRDALAYCASYFLLLDKSDDRSQAHLALAQAKLKAMIAAENRQKTMTSKNRGRLIPRQDTYWRSKRYVVQESS